MIPTGKLMIVERINSSMEDISLDLAARNIPDGWTTAIKLTDGKTSKWEFDNPIWDYRPVKNILENEDPKTSNLVDGGFYIVQISYLSTIGGFEGLYKEVCDNRTVTILGALGSQEKILKGIGEHIDWINKKEGANFQLDKIISHSDSSVSPEEKIDKNY